MKMIKKISAWFLALAMVFSMSGLTVFAAGAPSVETKTNITVNGIESGATVRAYQIVKGQYSTNPAGLIKYESVSDFVINDPEHPTDAEINAIYSQIASDTTNKYPSVEMTETSQGSNTYTSVNPVDAGIWLVRVTGANVKKVYQRMTIAVNYNSEGELVAEPLNAKSSDITVIKTIAEKEAAEKLSKDAIIGTIIPFKITTVLPDYSRKDFTKVTFAIKDTLDSGLEYQENSLVVKNGADTLEAGEGKDYTLTVNGQNITVDLSSSYILAHPTAAITVTYNAKLLETATMNFDANKNTVYVTYSNDPTNTTDTEKKENYIYTFEINGEILKQGEDETEQNPHAFLPGARFELVNSENSEESYEAVTGEDGKLVFKGLKQGTYTLQEIEAPKGYSLNTTIYTVTISAKYNEETGKLEEYTVVIKDSNAELANVTHKSTDESTTTTFENAAKIPNTRMSILPSTGGMGTYLFTFGGVTLMTIAAVMMIINRKSKQSMNK